MIKRYFFLALGLVFTGISAGEAPQPHQQPSRFNTEERCPICLTTISELAPEMHAKTPCCNQFICADDLAILRALGKPCPLCRSTKGWEQLPHTEEAPPTLERLGSRFDIFDIQENAPAYQPGRMLRRFLHFGHSEGVHTPLHQAASTGDLTTVRAILAAPGLVAVRAENPSGQIPLHVAAMNNKANVIRELLNKDSGLINMYDLQERTTLYLAAQNGATDAVRELLRVPTIDVNRRSVEGLTAAEVAERNGYPSIAQMIRAHGTAGH